MRQVDDCSLDQGSFLKSEFFKAVLISTDDDEIASVAESCGADTPFRQPPELSDDHAATMPVIAHAIQWWKRSSKKILDSGEKSGWIEFSFPNPMNYSALPKNTSPIGKPSNTPIFPLPEIPLEMRRETRPLEKNVEKMLLDMGFQPLTEEMRNRLIAAGHYGMPKE